MTKFPYLDNYRDSWPIRDFIQCCLKNSSKNYRRKQLLLEAHTQISTLKDEASELARYIKQKGKAVEVRDKEMTASGSGGRYIKGKGKAVEVRDKEAAASGRKQ